MAGSTDGTREFLSALATPDGGRTRPDLSELEGNIGAGNIRVFLHDKNRGKGAAVRTGLLAARTPIGLFSDADLSTPLEETPKLIEPIANGELDIAFGSRALDRSLIGIRQPWRREQAGRIFNLLVRLATGLPK